MLVMVIVLPDSRRAFWAARRSTALLHLAAAADPVVGAALVVVEAVAGGVVVVADAAEDGAPAERFRPEEPHPAAISVITTAKTSRPMVVRRIASHHCLRGSDTLMIGQKGAEQSTQSWSNPYQIP
jgi:hemin uptake protein HemP